MINEDEPLLNKLHESSYHNKSSVPDQVPSKPPTNLFELIGWLSPAFHTLETYVQHQNKQILYWKEYEKVIG